ncbi:MAG: hypothetical protein WAX33_04385 [Rectinemataceae bacterium]
MDMSYGQVYESFWGDPNIVDSFSPEDRYFYLYLMTCPQRQQCGIFEISVKQIAFDLGYSIDSSKTILDRFEQVHKRIRYNPETREIALLNWAKYNYPKVITDNRFKCIASQLATVKDKSLINLVLAKAEPGIRIALSPNISPLQAPSEGLLPEALTNTVTNTEAGTEDAPAHEDVHQSKKADTGRPNVESEAPPAVQLMLHWYRVHQQRTSLLIAPSDEDRRAAVDAVSRLSGDIALALRAVDWYWEHWEDLWFARRKRGEKAGRQTPVPDWNFRSFAGHIDSCLPPVSAPKPAKKEKEAANVDRF